SLGHGAPSFGSLRSYALNDRCTRFLHIFSQQEQSPLTRGSCFSREQLVNDRFGIELTGCLSALNFGNACGETAASPPRAEVMSCGAQTNLLIATGAPKRVAEYSPDRHVPPKG